MSVPKSITKIKNGNVTYISSVDKVQYTIKELCRAALRDTGKYVCNRFRVNFYATHKRKSGKVSKWTQWWVRSREIDLQVGLKPNGFYGGFQELGTLKEPRQGLLKKSVEENIPKLVEIQSQYLSALENESKALSLINESEMEGE